MIVGTLSKFDVGKQVVVQQMNDNNCKAHFNVTVFILEEVTRQDYLDYQKEQGNTPPPTFDIQSFGAHFYRISMD